MKNLKFKLFAIVGVLMLTGTLFFQPHEADAYDMVVLARRDVVERPGQPPVSSCIDCDPQGICFVISCTKPKKDQE